MSSSLCFCVSATTYALHGPDDEWSLMIVNRDQFTAHQVSINFHEQGTHMVSSFTGQVAVSTFGREQYQWHPAMTVSLAQSAQAAQNPVITNTKGYADPDGPILRATKSGSGAASYEIPAASIVVLRGRLGQPRKTQ